MDQPKNEDFEFENREKELLKFVEISVKNYEVSRNPATDNDEKLILPIASQMLGSGKTWFGRFLLKSLAKNRHKFGQFDAKVLDYIASSCYVAIDMRKIPVPYNERNLVWQVLDSLINFSPTEVKQEAMKYWDKKDISGVKLKSVALWFFKAFNRPILFHFDEVDSIARDGIVCELSFICKLYTYLVP